MDWMSRFAFFLTVAHGGINSEGIAWLRKCGDNRNAVLLFLHYCNTF
jgi:hypothetical protein